MNPWYDALRNTESLGRQTRRPVSLADLHARRAEHIGQFWTPNALARYVWQLVTPAIDAAYARDEARVSILDNSIGIGRLIQFIHPARHIVGGVDVHGSSIEALSAAIAHTGIIHDIHHAAMECVRIRGYNVALINPAFSLHLESPMLEPFSCTTWGRFGPNTSAVSHLYALHQALNAAELVAAILPLSAVEEVERDAVLTARLQAVLILPSNSFAEEGANVRTALLVFNRPSMAEVMRISVNSLDDMPPRLDLYCSTEYGRSPLITRLDSHADEPVITRALTGDRTVNVAHDGRKVVLKFRCALTEAKVLNEILGDRLPFLSGHRYPAGFKYEGQGALDLQVHLLQGNPRASFDAFVRSIAMAGGVPVVDPGIYGYLRRQWRAVQRGRVPLRQAIVAPHARATGSHELKKTLVLNPGVWGGPMMRKGERVFVGALEDGSGAYEVRLGDARHVIAQEKLGEYIDLGLSDTCGWQVKNEGRCHADPLAAQALMKKAKGLGIDRWLSWDYQLHDLVEMTLSPTGLINGWKMGLGKTRLILAMALLSGRRRILIETQANLIDEFMLELNGLPIAPESYQVITSPAQTRTLRTLNFISRERLRMPLCAAHKRTYASLLRRRIGLHLADEGDTLSTMDSDQTRASWQVSARRRHLFTGTPIPNYPRDILPLLTFVAGDGTALMPYGIRRGYLEPRWRDSVALARRGVDQFREDFVSFEWVTHEFLETMQTGAKREIPRINNVPKFRALVSRFVKRRVPMEPEVARHVVIPQPEEHVHTVPWDRTHLEYYLRVAEEFAAWYTEYRRRQFDDKKQLNLLAILARIRAVRTAANCPHLGVDSFGRYDALTSKQRAVIGHARALIEAGHKVILYAERPETLNRLGEEFHGLGINPVLYHGGFSVRARFKALNQFRHGDRPLLLGTYAVTQRGHNIPQADRVLKYEREWTAKTEDQAGARILRGQQKGLPVFDAFHLEGSIDDYQGQLVTMKRNCVAEGLDWGTPEDAGEFLHLDTILMRFCERLGIMKQRRFVA